MPDKPTSLSVVIPCFNERETIATVVERVRASLAALPLEHHEIIVVDDGSTDGTREVLHELAGQVDQIILHERNRGKGAALRTGISVACMDLVVFQDADLEYDPREYPDLLQPILEYGADAVYGSRFVGDRAHRALYFWHSVANRSLTFLSNALTDLNLTDMETCLKMVRREHLQAIRLVENRFGIEPEITAKLAKRGCVIYEVGISYAGRTYAEGKKIRWRDGLRAVYAILRYNLFR